MTKALININGGLGNQLFHYCAYIYTKQCLGKRSEPNFIDFLFVPHHFGIEIHKIFDVGHNIENKVLWIESIRQKSLAGSRLSQLCRYLYFKRYCLRLKLFRYKTIKSSDSSALSSTKEIEQTVKNHRHVYLYSAFQRYEIVKNVEKLLIATKKTIQHIRRPQ